MDGIFFNYFLLILQRISLGSSLAAIAAGPCSHGLAEGSWEYHVYIHHVSNMNVAVLLCFASHCSTEWYFVVRSRVARCSTE